MRYQIPELDVILFEMGDILTDSNELPIIPAQVGDEVESFDEP